jgi:tRNA G18 (ribose-2'-O)-methylase SpoU
MKSHVNVSAVARAAGCSGVRRLVVCGNAKVRDEIARDSVNSLTVEVHRTLEPYLAKQKQLGVSIIGLELSSRSIPLPQFLFPRHCVLVIGNEARGLSVEALALCDHCVEIPMFGPPFSHNAAMSAAIALYEYCRQYPSG